MLKIGDFARLGQVSVVTLRHYDEVGLFRPESVDASTATATIARRNWHGSTIIALKDLGFSLKQIEQVLDGLTPSNSPGC